MFLKYKSLDLIFDKQTNERKSRITIIKLIFPNMSRQISIIILLKLNLPWNPEDNKN